MCPLAAPLTGSPGSFLNRGVMVCHCLLVETDSAGLVLIDTGFGIRDCEGHNLHPIFRRIAAPVLDIAETAIEQVRALGFEPEDVRHIVVTHLDVDHAGGLPDFPWASVHLHARERDAALSPRTMLERNRYIQAHWAHDPEWRTYEDAGDDWFGFRAVRQLDGISEDIALIPLFGHTRGHSGIAVRIDDRWILHAGDAFFNHRELDAANRCPLGLRLFQEFAQVNRRTRIANADRLRSLHRAHSSEVDIVCAHDPAHLAAFRN